MINRILSSGPGSTVFGVGESALIVKIIVVRHRR